MILDKDQINIKKKESSEESIDINLVEIFSYLLRNKLIVVVFTILGFFSSSIYALSINRVWQGEFQIVLEESEEKNENFIRNSLRRKNRDLRTQVAILNSPSVLLNTFDFVKSKKIEDKNSSENLRFNEWRDNSLNVKLLDSTYVLNIIYKDNNKKLVLPVLKNISKKYQKYAQEEKKKNIKSSLDFYESIIIPNKMQYIGNQLAKLKNPNLLDDDFLYLLTTMPTIINEDFFENLEKVDNNLISLRTIFKESDLTIKNELKRRQMILDSMKRYAIKTLEGIQRDDEVLNKKLISQNDFNLDNFPNLNTLQNFETIEKLEEEYANLLIENAKGSSPWKLITEPTLLPNPIAPRRKFIVFLGLIIGFLIGCFVAICIENKKSIIFTKSQLRNILDYPILIALSNKEKKEWEESLNFIFKVIQTKNKENLLVYSLSKNKDINELQKLISKLSKDKIKVSKNPEDLILSENLIPLLFLGETTTKDVIEFNKKSYILGKNPFGLFIVE